MYFGFYLLFIYLICITWLIIKKINLPQLDINIGLHVFSSSWLLFSYLLIIISLIFCLLLLLFWVTNNFGLVLAQKIQFNNYIEYCIIMLLNMRTFLIKFLLYIQNKVCRRFVINFVSLININRFNDKIFILDGF